MALLYLLVIRAMILYIYIGIIVFLNMKPELVLIVSLELKFLYNSKNCKPEGY